MNCAQMFGNLKQTPAALHVVNAFNCSLKTGVWHYSHDLLQIPWKLYWLSLHVDQFYFSSSHVLKIHGDRPLRESFTTLFHHLPLGSMCIRPHITPGSGRGNACYRLLEVTKKQHALFQSAPVSSVIIHGEGNLLQKQQQKKK